MTAPTTATGLFDAHLADTLAAMGRADVLARADEVRASSSETAGGVG